MDTTDKTKSAISTSALSTPQTPFQLAQLPDLSQTYLSSINSSAALTQQGLDTATAEQQAQLEQQKRVQGAGAIADLTRMAGGQAQERANLAQTGGENELLKQISGYNTQAQGLAREATAIPLQLQQDAAGRGMTDRGIAPLQTQQLRDNALKSLTLAQSAAIAQGNYDVAKNLADQQVNAKYAQIDAEIAARKINEEALYKNVTDPAIKKALEARMALTKKEEQAQAEKKAAETAVNNMLIEASPVAPPDVMAKATKIKNEGGSAIQVAQALGAYGKDFMKNELLKEQLKTEVSQRAKIASDISVNNAQIRNYDASASKTKAETGALTNPITGVIGKPLTEVQAKDLLYAQRGEQANGIIDKLQSSIVKMGSTDFTTQKLLESSSLTSGKVSDTVRQVRQAERNFATAVLRKESGAAISPSEFSTVEKQYFPRPGDDTQTLAQKKTNRETYISGTKSGVPGYDQRVMTPESSYLDAVDSSLKQVEQKTTPINSYTSRLIGLPGVK